MAGYSIDAERRKQIARQAYAYSGDNRFNARRGRCTLSI